MLNDLADVTQLRHDEALEAKTPNQMHSPYISVIIPCQLIESCSFAESFRTHLMAISFAEL